MVLIGNLRKRKMFSGIIMILSVLTATFLVSATGIMIKASVIYETSYDKAGEADLFYGFISEAPLREYEDFFKERAEVKGLYWEESLIGTTHMKEEENLQTVFSVFRPEKRNYTTIPSDIDMLERNEILLPLCFEDEYSLEIGDEFFYEDMKFKIKGFFEDPIYGTPFYAFKRVLISDTSLGEMRDKTEYRELQKLQFMHIYLKDEYRGETFCNTIKELDGGFEGRGHSLFAFDRANLQNVRTIVPRIILIILLVFSLFLMSIMMIVIRYTILAAIEDDYSSLGVMKALGFKNGNLTVLLLGQYLSVVFTGSLIGILLAYMVTPAIGTFLLETSGIVWSENISIQVTVLISVLLLLFIGALIFSQINQVRKVKPVEAIAQARRESKNVKNRFLITSNWTEKMPLSVKMGIKQLSSKIGQYVSMLMLITIFSFMILTVISLSNVFGTDENISGILGYEINDISMEFAESNSVSEEELEEIFHKVDEKYEITYLSSYNDRYKVYSDKMQIQLLVNSEFDGTNLIEGRIPGNENEVMISSGISKSLHKKIGDTITISLEKDSKTQRYMVVGINNKVHSMGKNISMTDDGFLKLQPEYSPTQYYMKIADEDCVEQAIEEIKNEYAKKYPDISVTNERETILKRTQAISMVFRMISIIIIAISLFLIGLITFLVSLVVIKRETYQFGIMKSIGFTSGQIRIQFAFRFALVALFGAVLGMGIYGLSDNRLINGLFSIVNIANIPSGTTISSYLFDFLFIMVVAYLCAWIVSCKIKMVKVKDLIIE